MKRVLIAEDDDDARTSLRAVVEELGLEAAEARDGLDAIRRLREEAWDLTIVDLLMPRLDGYVVIRYLEEQRPTLRAIVISGVRAEELEDVGRSPAVEAVLAKPLDVGELATAIHSALGA